MGYKGVIKRVDQPTDWVNSLVTADKASTGKLPVCLNPRDLNKAIKREHFQLPTMEEIASRLELPYSVNSMPIVDTGTYPSMKLVNSSH